MGDVQTWIVRAGQDDEFEREAMEHGTIAMGWRQLGDLTPYRTPAEIRAAVDAAYPQFSARSRQVAAVQLYAFRCKMRVGDHVVLLRSTAPDLAVGTITGDYTHRPELAGQHVRPVRWARVDVSRAELGTDLLAVPALTSIYRVGRTDATARVEALLNHSRRPTPPPPVSTAPTTAVDNLRRNLEYALSLATAGQHLQQLKVEAFEVSDVFRAAWVQSVAALDHWVHQEIRERMLTLAGQPAGAWPKQFQRFQLPIGLVERVAAQELTVAQAVDLHWSEAFGRLTFQQPDKIREGLAHVADVAQFWQRVATVLTERATDGVSYDAKQVQERLNELVVRRNKIAHEYDEDPANAPHKRDIDAASTTKAVEWIRQLVEAMIVVLNGTP
ncbi:hypothetical protein ABZS66_42465 [Dactylosporangium sp. NPDC005572]|uniref:hypothetical protein n=1 Tax=Dactylosporangium sp. NPDC005572 TaxID=3156889 RepID=UPI0033B85E68